MRVHQWAAYTESLFPPHGNGPAHPVVRRWGSLHQPGVITVDRSTVRDHAGLGSSHSMGSVGELLGHAIDGRVMSEHILLCIDGGSQTTAAIEYALSRAAERGAELRAVFVVDVARFPEPALGTAELSTHAMESHGASCLDELAAAAADREIAFDGVCCHGRPNEVVEQVAAEFDPDVIVCGHHGRSPMEQADRDVIRPSALRRWTRATPDVDTVG